MGYINTEGKVDSNHPLLDISYMPYFDLPSRSPPIDYSSLPTEVLIAKITVNASIESAVISELNLVNGENTTIIFGGKSDHML